MDVLVKNPETIRCILDDDQVFSVERVPIQVHSHNKLVAAKCPVKVLAHLGQGRARQRQEKLYHEVKHLNRLNIKFIEKEWDNGLTKIPDQLLLKSGVNCREHFVTILRMSFMHIYGIEPQRIFALEKLSLLLKHYLSGATDKDYSDEIRSKAAELIEAVPTTMRESLSKEEVEEAAINLGFLFFAAIDNTASSLLATAHLQCKGLLDNGLDFDDINVESLARICQPAVRIIARFCVKDTELNGQNFHKGDRAILSIMPTGMPLQMSSKQDLMFGSGIHVCPGRKLVLMHTKYLVRGLHHLRKLFRVESFGIPVKNPYLAGLEELTIKRAK